MDSHAVNDNSGLYCGSYFRDSVKMEEHKGGIMHIYFNMKKCSAAVKTSMVIMSTNMALSLIIHLKYIYKIVKKSCFVSQNKVKTKGRKTKYNIKNKKNKVV